MNPTYSFLTCTYQCASFIERCYWSLKKQNVTDWEWVVVDDGSTDTTEQIFASIIDSRIKYHRFKNNRGRGIARNYAIQQARGNWGVIMDMDDFSFPNRLQHAEIARKAGYDFLCSSLVLINYDYTTQEIRGFKKDTYPKLFPHGTLCAKIDLLKAVPYPLYSLAEDQMVTLTIANNYRGYYCSEPLYIYHEDANINLKKAFLGHYYTLRQLNEMRKKNWLKSHAAIYYMKLNCLIKLFLLIPLFVYPKSYRWTLALRSTKLCIQHTLSKNHTAFIDQCAALFPITRI